MKLPSLQESEQLYQKYPKYLKKQAINNLILYDYLIPNWVMFRDDPLALNLRGIVFDRETTELVSAPLFKFFNLNENPAVMENNLKMSGIAVEKIDGSMAQVTWWNGDLFVASRGSMSDETGYVRPAVTRLINYKYTHLREIITYNNHLTFIFEYLDPAHPIVITPTEEELVLLAARNKITGAVEYPRTDLGVRVPRSFRFAPPDWEVMKDRLHNDKYSEGYVLHLDCGTWVKAKSLWYLRAHRVVTNLSERSVVEAWADDKLDDVLSVAREVNMDTTLIEVLAHKIETYLTTIISGYTNHYRNKPSLSIKDIALHMQEYPRPTPLCRWLFGTLMRHVRRGTPDEQLYEKLFIEIKKELVTNRDAVNCLLEEIGGP